MLGTHHGPSSVGCSVQCKTSFYWAWYQCYYPFYLVLSLCQQRFTAVLRQHFCAFKGLQGRFCRRKNQSVMSHPAKQNRAASSSSLFVASYWTLSLYCFSKFQSRSPLRKRIEGMRPQKGRCTLGLTVGGMAGSGGFRWRTTRHGASSKWNPWFWCSGHACFFCAPSSKSWRFQWCSWVCPQRWSRLGWRHLCGWEA